MGNIEVFLLASWPVLHKFLADSDTTYRLQLYKIFMHFKRIQINFVDRVAGISPLTVITQLSLSPVFLDWPNNVHSNFQLYMIYWLLCVFTNFYNKRSLLIMQKFSPIYFQAALSHQLLIELLELANDGPNFINKLENIFSSFQGWFWRFSKYSKSALMIHRSPELILTQAISKTKNRSGNYWWMILSNL